MFGPLNFISKLVKPVFDGIDSLSTSQEEKDQANIALKELENAFGSKMIELESQLIQAQSAVIIAEAQSQSWIARNWRPLIMIEFGTLIALIATGYMDTDALNAVPEELWQLLTMGIGGYIVARSVDKNVPKYFASRTEKKEDA